ncbi:hypothetical protein SISSUDRAFT_977722 [Sistotremastrum suecicum HHB10207 ss-3]|uniref:Amino acid transporter transmembrane domain-containing protein n=1 Tax=Sistotremastrum suecicum HHB10207 ss-3 TaxID=1314776 RepID=A0A166IIH4_9AGAM|nr:hypothetical protein SISSUDRAFT_977722 [Sistotremastrum suecicum HHB10207 ss-3]
MAYTGAGNLALDGPDPRIHMPSEQQELTQMTPEHYKPSFEESMYWAALEREHEATTTSAMEASHYSGLHKKILGRGEKKDDSVSDHTYPPDKKHGSEPRIVSEDERHTAARALRTAGWVSVFYLITTDILGPYSAPWAFSQLGYVSGCLIFFFFGAIAAYTGFLLWWMYLKLDSARYPVKTYSDLGGRIYNPIVRHGINILQSIQLLFNVAVIILGNGQGLSQVAKNRVCFSALCIIWTVVGMVIGQIRSLRNFGWLANLAIWMNLIVLFCTMGVVAHSGPNLVAAVASGLIDSPADAVPIVHSAVIHIPFTNQIVGVMQIVYSYGGAMLFIEFMAEMRRPWDFWKGMVCAQLFIFIVYMLFGLFVYAFQGQYTVNPANQGIATFGWQTATNIISFLSALIAAGLYGNIGIKVLYVNVLEELFGFPSLLSKSGRYIWTVTVLCYWSFAFVIASAIPQFSNISGIVAALCILQFTYSFPPLLFLGFQMHVDAIEGDRPYEPGMTESPRVDSWGNWSRWKRAITKYWYFKLFNLLFGMAALATAGLGAYSSILGIINGFKDGSHASSFGCQSPVA